MDYRDAGQQIVDVRNTDISDMIKLLRKQPAVGLGETT
jgi:hypothetical protein